MFTGEELLQRTITAARVTSLVFSTDSRLQATGHADSAATPLTIVGDFLAGSST